MSAPVYSTQFLAYNNLSNTWVQYTVPAGFVAVVKDISAVAQAAGSGTVLAAVAGGITFWNWVSPSGAGADAHFEGMVVMPSGKVLQMGTAATAISFIVSGYLLSNA